MINFTVTSKKEREEKQASGIDVEYDDNHNALTEINERVLELKKKNKIRMSYYVIPRAPIGPVKKNVVSDPPFGFRPCCHVVAVALLNKEFK